MKVPLPSYNHELYIEPKLKDELDYVKNLLKDKWSIIWIVTSSGVPGVGKTTMASQLGAYIDPGFTLDKCSFTGRDLINTTLKLGLEGNSMFSMQYDEAKESLDKMRQMSEMFRDTDLFLHHARQFRPFLIIVTPNLFDLPKKVVVNMASAVINVYYEKDEEHKKRLRGMFNFYGMDSKRYLYFKGHKFENHIATHPDFHGRFTKWMPFNEDEYNAKKIAAAEAMRQESEKKQKNKGNLDWHYQVEANAAHHFHGIGWSDRKIGDELGGSTTYWNALRNKYKLKTNIDSNEPSPLHNVNTVNNSFIPDNIVNNEEDNDKGEEDL